MAKFLFETIKFKIYHQLLSLVKMIIELLFIFMENQINDLNQSFKLVEQKSIDEFFYKLKTLMDSIVLYKCFCYINERTFKVRKRTFLL